MLVLRDGSVQSPRQRGSDPAAGPAVDRRTWTTALRNDACREREVLAAPDADACDDARVRARVRWARGG
jgi:hypothetical protein